MVKTRASLIKDSFIFRNVIATLLDESHSIQDERVEER